MSLIIPYQVEAGQLRPEAEKIVRETIEVIQAGHRHTLAAAYGRAAGAVIFNKPPEKVTAAEAVMVSGSAAVVDDPTTSHRAHRAGMRAMLEVAAKDLFPVGPTARHIDGLIHLDVGEATDWTIPAPDKRNHPANRADRATWLAIEVNYWETRLNRKRSYAIGAVTDCWQNDIRPPDAPSPTMRSARAFRDLWRQVEIGEKLDPEAIAEARREGERERLGGEPSADFHRRRKEIIAAWLKGKV